MNPGTPQCSKDCTGDAGVRCSPRSQCWGRLGRGLRRDRHVLREQRAVWSEPSSPFARGESVESLNVHPRDQGGAACQGQHTGVPPGVTAGPGVWEAVSLRSLGPGWAGWGPGGPEPRGSLLPVRQELREGASPSLTGAAASEVSQHVLGLELPPRQGPGAARHGARVAQTWTVVTGRAGPSGAGPAGEPGLCGEGISSTRAED